MKKLLALVVFLAGCDAQPPVPPPPAKAPENRELPAPEQGEGHQHQAPHGGMLVELGDHFANLEIVFDASTGSMTAYVLDGHADGPVRIEQKEIVLQFRGFTVALQAVGSPLTGETPGNSSQFEARSENLKGLQAFEATIVKIAVKGSALVDVPFSYPKGLQPRPKQD